MKRQMMTAVAVCALAFTAGCAATTTPDEALPLQADGGEQTFTPAPVTATTQLAAFDIDTQRLRRLTPAEKEYLSQWLG